MTPACRPPDEVWQPSEPDEMFKVEYLDEGAGVWRPCMFTNLRKGVLCRFFAPDGRPIDPMTFALIAGEHRPFVCLGDPFKNPGGMTSDGKTGYVIELQPKPPPKEAN